MLVRNSHQRDVEAPAAVLGSLLDTLASVDDAVWPIKDWPRMRLDRPLGIGARGGHGPIRYTVVAYEPAQRVRFQFDAPKGFDGYHEFRVEAGEGPVTRLVHDLIMQTHGTASVSWPLVYRPLHDALVEDALARTAGQVGESVSAPRWSFAVRLLRRLLTSRIVTRRTR